VVRVSATSGLEFGGASLRYGQPLAPGGLALVQDLLATSPAGRPREPDLLASPATATAWAGAAMSDWSAISQVPVTPLDFSETDVEELRQLRDELRTVLVNRDHGGGDPPAGRAWSLTLGAEFDHTACDPAHSVRLGPRGTGWRTVASAVLLEVFLAQRDGSWQRLKVCRNTRCLGAFYDRSRNNSGVWHEVRTCGNVANLRASRARRRAQGPVGPR
jgi:predicted RNA-binding Zn ribbon-like protein